MKNKLKNIFQYLVMLYYVMKNELKKTLLIFYFVQVY
jgi:hypothetical protein